MLLRSESEVFPLCLVSPGQFLRCCVTLKRIFTDKSSEMEATKAVHSGAVEKYKRIEEQVSN